MKEINYNPFDLSTGRCYGNEVILDLTDYEDYWDLIEPNEVRYNPELDALKEEICDLRRYIQKINLELNEHTKDCKKHQTWPWDYVQPIRIEPIVVPTPYTQPVDPCPQQPIQPWYRCPSQQPLVTCHNHDYDITTNHIRQ